MAARETVTVDERNAGVRLDRLLASFDSIGSREKARQALRSGKVSIAGEVVGLGDAGRVLSSGTEVVIQWNVPGTGRKRTAGREALARAGVSVLYEDADVLVAEKPPGLLTDAADSDQAKHRDTLRKRVRAWVGGADVRPAHRIDRDTSGVVLFAKTDAAWEHLRGQWAKRSPERVYVAIVEGRVKGDRGRFRDWMAWDAARRLQRPCAPDAPGAFLAEATWRVTERLRDATLLEVTLVTGRRNQIRLHAMLMGHPLVGEPLYREQGRARISFPRQALHAAHLGFVHPGTGQRVRFSAAWPDDLRILVERLRADG
jgi:23S rRNA pseudouridine1911/1915/1917 synthase